MEKFYSPERQKEDKSGCAETKTIPKKEQLPPTSTKCPICKLKFPLESPQRCSPFPLVSNTVVESQGQDSDKVSRSCALHHALALSSRLLTVPCLCKEKASVRPDLPSPLSTCFQCVDAIFQEALTLFGQAFKILYTNEYPSLPIPDISSESFQAQCSVEEKMRIHGIGSILAEIIARHSIFCPVLDQDPSVHSSSRSASISSSSSFSSSSSSSSSSSTSYSSSSSVRYSLRRLRRLPRFFVSFVVLHVPHLLFLVGCRSLVSSSPVRVVRVLRIYILPFLYHRRLLLFRLRRRIMFVVVWFVFFFFPSSL